MANYLPAQFYEGIKTNLSRRMNLALIGIFLISLLAVTIVPQSLQAQTTPRPNPPIREHPSVGDTEAIIKWRSGGSGVGGNCSTTEFWVRIYDITNRTVFEESTFITRMGNGTHQWYVDDLSPSTKYMAEVDAYGEDCDEYSSASNTWDGTLNVDFTTNATNSGSDPTEPASNAKKAPFRVRNLSVSTSSTTATASWTKPRANNAKRCSLEDPREYGYLLQNLTTGAESHGDVSNNGNNVSTALTNLTVGHKYMLSVASYSEDCDDYSRYRHFSWTQ